VEFSKNKIIVVIKPTCRLLLKATVSFVGADLLALQLTG
jgi:hypothetical protein